MKGIITPTEPVNTRPLDEYRATEEFDNYERLCRGEETIVSTLFLKSPHFGITPSKTLQFL